jgi:hypothetical protein
MGKIIFIFVIVFLSLIQVTYGQKDCNTQLVIGEWKITKSIYWGIHTNVDSLRLVSQGDTSSPVVTIRFNGDDTYRINLADGKNQRNGYYFIDTEKCEIILSRNKKNMNNLKYKERANWEIIFLDKEIIIYKEDTNPKSYATHVLLKN